MTPSPTAAAAIVIVPARLSPSRLSTPDLAIVALYLIAITLFGLRFSKKSGQKGSSLKSYFLADNTIPWWAISLSIVSAETSTLTIVSIPGVAFGGDFGFLQIVLGYMLGRIVVAALFLPKYFRGEMLTAYQLIDQRFGHTLHKVTAGLFLLTRAAAEGVRVFAISIVVGIAIGTGDTLSIFIISALTLLYTFEGGMAAVIWTDVVQMALYVAGTLVALLTLGRHVPGGWSQIHAVAAPLGKFHMLNFAFNLTQSYTFWAGILGGTFLTMASHGTDQLMVQRMLAARSLRESRLALLSSGVVIFFQFTLFLLIGVGLFVFYGATNSPGAPFIAPSAMNGINGLSPDRIFPTFIVREMPHGIAGLLVAAILAAAMSNLSAALNSLSSTTVVDFYLPFLSARLPRTPVILSEARSAQSKDPEDLTLAQKARSTQPRSPSAEAPQANTTLVSRLATVFWAIILFAIAVYSIQHGGKGHVVETGLSIASVAYGCLLGVFLLGTLTKYATQVGTIVGMITGFAFNLILWLTPPNSGWTYTTPEATHYIAMPHIAFTWYVLLGALMTFLIGLLASAILPKPRRALAAMLCLIALTLPSRSEAQSQNAPHPGAPHLASEMWDSVEARHPSSQSGDDLSPPASRYPEASASGLTSPAKEGGLQSLGHAVQSQPQISRPAFDFSEVSTLITQAIAEHKLPGAIVLIGHNNQIVFHKAYGDRKLAGEPGLDGNPSPAEPMTEDTIFDMASLSKVLATTTAVLQLYEQKKLDLDTPVAHYLPDFAENGKQSITIRQLLTHYSGLPEDVSLKDDWGLKSPEKAEGIRRAIASTPYGPPGQTFKYSDINFITLGALVEELSGEPLDVYGREHVFTPLGMTSTAYHPYDKTCGPAIHTGAAIEPGPKPVGKIGMVCLPGTWSPYALDPTIAPTAHDDESKLNPSLNPNFDHLLRGTVHDPTTRRMGGVAGHAGVFSTAADAAKFCQALLDKVTKNTGPFPLTQATLRLATRPNEPAAAVTSATIFTQDLQPTKGIASRGLGWDLNTAFSRPRGTIFPITTKARPGSFGHTGFTGTSLWLDPTSNTYVILLANAIHPRGGAPISPLRSQVATAAAKVLGVGAPSSTDIPIVGQGRVSSEARPPSLFLFTAYAPGHPMRSAAQPKDPEASRPAQTSRTTQPRNSQSQPQTLTGIDVLEQTNFAALTSLPHPSGKPLRIALLTNQSGLDRQGHRTIDILAQARPDIELTKLFSPEHGLYGHQDTEHLTTEQDPTTHLPVISLYGPKPADKHPKQSDLKNVDAVVIDLQDAGVRFWTYETLVGYFLEATAHAHMPLVILDRPNPIGGLATQGATSDYGFESTYTDFMPIPLRHGLTLGELARYFNRYATEIQLKPELSRGINDGEATIIGTPTPQDPGNELPPATQPGLHADLHVIPMQNWTRGQYYDSTGLPWTPPSPNLRTSKAAILYPALGTTEGTNVSVGRGTETPFENMGAPYIHAEELAQYLNARKIPGVQITPTTMTIAEDANHYPFHGQTIPALHFEVTDRTQLDSPELGIELLAALHHLYPADFKLARAKNLLANAATLDAITADQDPEAIAAGWQPTLADFRARSTPFLLYPPLTRTLDAAGEFKLSCHKQPRNSKQWARSPRLSRRVRIRPPTAPLPQRCHANGRPAPPRRCLRRIPRNHPPRTRHAAVKLCGADSAGISIERDGKTADRYYRWIATAGEYSGFLDASLPQYPSACTVCLERNSPSSSA